LLETVTHARLRAEQGDAAGAVRILRAVLARRPGDAEARELLASLPGGAAPPASAAARLRLQRFLDAVTRHAR
jgi:hypothetical protein